MAHSIPKNVLDQFEKDFKVWIETPGGQVLAALGKKNPAKLKKLLKAAFLNIHLEPCKK